MLWSSPFCVSQMGRWQPPQAADGGASSRKTPPPRAASRLAVPLPIWLRKMGRISAFDQLRKRQPAFLRGVLLGAGVFDALADVGELLRVARVELRVGEDFLAAGDRGFEFL